MSPRREEIERNRRDHGRKALAVLPISWPRELATALGLLAVELWGPPGPPRGDGARRLQGYVCAVARNAFAFLESGGADAVDAVLFPHTCDSIQGIGTLAIDGGAWTKPAFTFLHPRGGPRESSRVFLDAELRRLAAGLAQVAGRPLDPERLRWALALHARLDAARAALLDGRARLPMDDGALYALLRRGEWRWPEDHLAELEAAVARLAPGPVQRGIPLLVSGYVPEPPGLLDAIGAAGGFVAADDFAAVGRRVVRRAPDPAADPWAELQARYWAAPPCSTRSADPDARVAWLRTLRERAGARGVIIHTMKFCEPELFDLPRLRRAFAEDGVPVLHLEGELERTLPAQAATRIEAFLELVRARGTAGGAP
jgi:benzoyl-CoA reductase/2-hydroxyglutaryl-CoA dehydratase subunit BcrC/BadD/HgdB